MNTKQKIVLIILGITVGLLTAGLYLQKDKSGLITLNGTVTAYDESPSYSDGAIIFEIDGESVDIGGGLRFEEVPSGEVYSPIKEGDKVTAKVRRTENGGLTIYECPDCYIRKK